MNLTAKSEYACLAMLELAQHYDARLPLQVRRIAQRHGIPSPFLVQILQEFKRAGLVSSTRGANGGYRLAQPPSDISLADVLNVFEGSSEPTGCAASESPLAPVLLDVCCELSRVRRELLAETTLADLLERATAETAQMWYI